VVLVLLLCLLPYWSFERGLRMGGGPVVPNANASGPLAALPITAVGAHDYCIGEHGIARRLWHSSKMFFMAIMCWELSFLPGSSWDVWAHHIGLILGVAISTDHRLREVLSGGVRVDAPTEAGESLDGFAYVLMLGTAFMFAKELLVLLFQHRKLSKTREQASDLLAAAVVHVLGQAAFYLVLPATYLFATLSAGHLPLRPSGAVLAALLFVLNVLEAYIFSITLKVMRIKRRKARAAAYLHPALGGGGSDGVREVSSGVSHAANAAPQAAEEGTMALHHSSLSTPLVAAEHRPR